MLLLCCAAVLLQAVWAEGLSEVLQQCTSRTPSPNDKLVRNIVSMACSETMAGAGSGAGAEGTAPGQADEGQRQLLERKQSHALAGGWRGAGWGWGSHGWGCGGVVVVIGKSRRRVRVDSHWWICHMRMCLRGTL